MFRFIFRLLVLGFLGFIWLLAGVYLYLSPNLPNVETLRDVRLQTPMRVYTREGDLIGQFGEKKRSPLRYEEIPDQFIKALLAAEDDGFFEHRGIDITGLMRAVTELLLTGEKVSGGSTLTMQVARNYFLSQERTFSRKFNEILLAIEIERALSKEEIFELYFNRVFLGHRAYGFQAAAQVYYGEDIRALDLAQLAMLAGIPKAPSRNNPISGPTAGKERRNWILGRMRELEYIDEQQFQLAAAQPDLARHHGARLDFSAPYAAEMARQQMLRRYGMAAYNEGYHVYTTVSSQLQRSAERAVAKGLLEYDRRHGYRGPERKLGDGTAPEAQSRWLATLQETPRLEGLQSAVVVSLDQAGATILLVDGSHKRLEWSDGLSNTRPYVDEDRRGPAPATVEELLEVGDLIRVTEAEGGSLQLAQIPAAQAALVALRPDDGAILSLIGGIGFERSKFNRATQARRQPGSNFKPFLYSAALDAGFTAASIINDAPVVVNDRSLEEVWRPENDGGKFHGPTRLREALVKSRNLVSIRLLQQLGTDKLIDYCKQLGLDTRKFARDLSLALGTQAMTPLELATAYAILANGGYRVKPYLIQHINNREGETIFEARPATVCRECNSDEIAPEIAEISMHEILAQREAAARRPPRAPRVMDEQVNFIINSILRDVIIRGTGHRARELKRGDIAGKTGTTNGPMDAWFSGYNATVVTTTWLGFDNYTPLGRREFGGTAALPIWIDFMRDALEGTAEPQPTPPTGLVHMRIDAATGKLARPGQSNALDEYFRRERAPIGIEKNGVELGTSDPEDLFRDIF